MLAYVRHHRRDVQKVSPSLQNWHVCERSGAGPKVTASTRARQSAALDVGSRSSLERGRTLLLSSSTTIPSMAPAAYAGRMFVFEGVIQFHRLVIAGCRRHAHRAEEWCLRNRAVSVPSVRDVRGMA